jgi:hypothetical protein
MAFRFIAELAHEPATMTPRTILSYIGFVLNLAIGAFVILAGTGKLGTPDETTIKMLNNEHILENLKLLGIGEIIVGTLLIVPWTSSLGSFLMCGFWGGTIVFHMSRGDDYTMQAAFLVVTILGTALRWPAMFSSFWWQPGQKPAPSHTPISQ